MAKPEILLNHGFFLWKDPSPRTCGGNLRQYSRPRPRADDRILVRLHPGSSSSTNSRGFFVWRYSRRCPNGIAADRDVRGIRDGGDSCSCDFRLRVRLGCCCTTAAAAAAGAYCVPYVVSCLTTIHRPSTCRAWSGLGVRECETAMRCPTKRGFRWRLNRPLILREFGLSLGDEAPSRLGNRDFPNGVLFFLLSDMYYFITDEYRSV